MIIKKDINLKDFEFWSGARHNANLLTNEELRKVENIIDDLFSEGINETQLNDIFWFDFDMICDWLGCTEDEVRAR